MPEVIPPKITKTAYYTADPKEVKKVAVTIPLLIVSLVVNVIMLALFGEHYWASKRIPAEQIKFRVQQNNGSSVEINGNQFAEELFKAMGTQLQALDAIYGEVVKKQVTSSTNK